MIRVLALLAAAFVATSAWAQGTVAIAPAGAWVRPVDIPLTATGETAAPVRFLLQDFQTRFGSDGDATYSEIALRFQTPQGLQAGTISIPWNPETDTLTVHKVRIVRGAQTIDVLAAGQTFTVLRRETNLDLATLDGVLTAAMQPEGLQVGDVLDIAFTIHRADPALRGRSQYLTGDLLPVPIARLHIRQVWGGATPLKWRVTDGLPAPTITKIADGTELVIDAKDVVRPTPPKWAPARYATVGVIESSAFADWGDVSGVLWPLFDKAATLKPDSPLTAEVARIRTASADPKVQAAAALRLVQDQVRYVYLGINDGGYVPAAADLTWSRRFGDCKGKTALLVALLRGLGIEARPALVNSHGADGLDAMMPTTLLFDHVIVRAVIGGRVYWLDGARSGDRALDTVPVPNLDWALPLQASGATLERLAPEPPAQPLLETRIRIDASAGIDAPAPAHLEAVFRGDLAQATRVGLDQAASEDRERLLHKFWSDQYSWIDIKTVQATYDDASGEQRLLADGTAKMEWTNGDENARQYEPDGSRVGWVGDFKRDPGPHQDAPLAVPFPQFQRATETIVLPRRGQGFSVSGADLEEKVAGRVFARQSAIVDGVFTMSASTETIAHEFPASEATSAAAKMKDLAERVLYLRAPRWYRATAQELDARIAAQPTDASGYVFRAEAYEEKGDFDHALADMDQAVKLQPKNAGMLNARCFAKAEANRDLAGALADCNAALATTPRDAPTLDSRAFVYFRLGQLDRAVADYNLALEIDRTQAPSLYVRGLARRRQGDLKGGDADIATAKAIDPDVADVYKQFGVTP